MVNCFLHCKPQTNCARQPGCNQTWESYEIFETNINYCKFVSILWQQLNLFCRSLETFNLNTDTLTFFKDKNRTFRPCFATLGRRPWGPGSLPPPHPAPPRSRPASPPGPAGWAGMSFDQQIVWRRWFWSIFGHIVNHLNQWFLMFGDLVMAKGGDVSPDVVDHIPPCCCRLQCHLAQPDNYENGNDENGNDDGAMVFGNHHLVWTSPGIWRTVIVFFLGSGRRPPSIAPSWGERKEKQHPIVTRISLLNLFVFLSSIFLISQTPVLSGPTASREC